MLEITIELLDKPDDPGRFVQALRLAAAVKCYELQQVSQGTAAEIAGLSRAEFLEALSRFGVSPFQQGAEEILADAGLWQSRGGPPPQT